MFREDQSIHEQPASIYALLFDPVRLEESLRYTDAYLALRPEHSGAILNRACALAQRVNDRPENKALVMTALRRLLSLDLGRLVRGTAEDDFDTLRLDPDFAALKTKAVNELKAQEEARSKALEE